MNYSPDLSENATTKNASKGCEATLLEILKKSSFFVAIAIVIVIFLFITKDDDIENGTTELNAISSPINNTEDEQNVPTNHVAFVDVKGSVLKPGVYEMDIGTRVNDVIQKAGGFSENADQTQVNLAQKVQDEMIIVIPQEGEVASVGGNTGNASGKISVNYATQEEIESLNGIGPSKAQAIIQYRDEHGPFQTVEDLLEVSGIGEKTLENLQDDIQVP